MMLERVRYLMQFDQNPELEVLQEKFRDILKQLDLIKKVIIKETIKGTWSAKIIIPRYEKFLNLYREALVALFHYL